MISSTSLALSCGLSVTSITSVQGSHGPVRDAGLRAQSGGRRRIDAGRRLLAPALSRPRGRCALVTGFGAENKAQAPAAPTDRARRRATASLQAALRGKRRASIEGSRSK